MTAAEQHVVFATTWDGVTVRVSDPMPWGAAQLEWRRLDDVRLAGVAPHVRHFEVRSEDDPQERFAKARLSLVHRGQVTLGPNGGLQRGTTRENAARRAWREFAPTFRTRRGHLTDETYECSDQGRGGWFYWPNGRTAAQGLRSLADLCARRGMIVRGKGGKWFVVNTLAA